ncbi:hypothetical protein ACHAWF_007779 [Thalassiosira exigua]
MVTPAICPENSKWLMLFGTTMLLLASMVHQHLIMTAYHVYDNGDGGRDVLTATKKNNIIDRTMSTSYSAIQKGNSIFRRLPTDFRLSSREECPAAQKKLISYAPASNRSKITPRNQKKFVMGGYTKIKRGSGDNKLLLPITMKLSKEQHEHGIYGTVAELGVHHGQFTGALFMTARESEKLIAADLFEELQYQNVDVSGNGDRKAFVRGLASYGLNETDLHLIHTGSTEDLPFDWHQQNDFEPFRLISVDAGHTAALTFNDLEVAFCNAAKGAIVMLDDFFHNLWPGVTEGFHQFASMGPVAEVYPFLRCEGKNFITNDKSMHQHYYKILISEPKFKPFLRAYAHQTRGTSVKYQMNGVEYLYCDSRKLEREKMHLMWKSLVY